MVLREPNHHQPKSNQRRRSAGLRRRLAISFSHRAVRLVAQPSGPSGYRQALLCARGERPSYRAAAEQRDELAPVVIECNSPRRAGGRTSRI
jgi:hypothetical protein